MSKIDEQLKMLNSHIIEMKVFIVNMINLTCQGFIECDKKIAKKAIGYDKQIDVKEREIEKFCIKLFIRQQPFAKDLRIVSSALKIITDMEHVGDQAAEISNLTLRIKEAPQEEEKKLINEMAIMTNKMINESVESFTKNDIKLASGVIVDDDKVDELFNKIKSKLINVAKNTPSKFEETIDLLMVAKYFERIGDHATSIANWAIFSSTGKHKIDIKNKK